MITAPEEELIENNPPSFPAVMEYINVVPASASVAAAVTSVVPAVSVSLTVAEYEDCAKTGALSFTSVTVTVKSALAVAEPVSVTTTVSVWICVDS